MNGITTQIFNEADIDLNAIQIYDPNQNHGMIEKFVVQCDTPQGSVGFLCRKVEINRILLELPEEIALALQNFRAQEEEELDDERDLTPKDIQRARYLNEYNIQSVKLGLLQPQLTEDQIRELPTTVIRDLTDAITDFVPEDEDTPDS